MKYDPDVSPDPTRWLETDDEERALAIRQYHKKAKEPTGQNAQLHAVIHAVVENQLAEGHAVAVATLSRLMTEGLERHDAIHAIGAIVAADLFDMMKQQAPHDPEQYARKLRALTAAGWRAGLV